MAGESGQMGEKDFHDGLLLGGNMPIEFVRARLLGELLPTIPDERGGELERILQAVVDLPQNSWPQGYEEHFTAEFNPIASFEPAGTLIDLEGSDPLFDLDDFRF